MRSSSAECLSLTQCWSRYQKSQLKVNSSISPKGNVEEEEAREEVMVKITEQSSLNKLIN